MTNLFFVAPGNANNRYSQFGTIAAARALFERVVGVKLSIKNAKTFFKKWLEFETVHGNETDGEKVKGLAREFVAGL